jgi:AcrR family transcriptional regulator
MARKRDGDQRRRDLCDAAIHVLADHGSRGLTHANVDRYAEVADGTTSYYYRTREALLRGVGKRVGEIDVANLQSVCNEPADAEHPFLRLAQLTLLQAEGAGLALNRARHELLLGAARDPDLAAYSRQFVGPITDMTHDAITRLRPGADNEDLRQAQATAVMTFIAGVFARLVGGDRSIRDPDELSSTLEALVVAIALRDRDAGTPRSSGKNPQTLSRKQIDTKRSTTPAQTT